MICQENTVAWKQLRKTYPFELRVHYVMQLIPDDGKLHEGVRAEDGTPEGQSRVVGASSVPPSGLSFGYHFRPLWWAA